MVRVARGQASEHDDVSKDDVSGVWEGLSLIEREELKAKVAARNKAKDIATYIAASYLRLKRGLARLDVDVQGNILIDDAGNIQNNLDIQAVVATATRAALDTDAADRAAKLAANAADRAAKTIPINDDIIREMCREDLCKWLERLIHGVYRRNGDYTYYNQADIARAIGVTSPTIYSWSNRKFLPSQHHRENIKRLLRRIRDGGSPWD